ncbi:MAG TPA: hypothetical protein VJ785_15130 [Anaerolineales bacterium]|nr:hypothetical protein [Anaerolineales bacterium]
MNTQIWGCERVPAAHARTPKSGFFHCVFAHIVPMLFGSERRQRLENQKALR